MPTVKPRLIGRSSSHFTRVTRIFALELGVAHDFEVVADLGSRDPAAYGGHPALRVPSLLTGRGTWFGALNVCRELERLSGGGARAVWPEALLQPAAANAQELVLQAMANEVTLITASMGGVSEASPFLVKAREGLANSLAWLDRNVDEALAALPPEPRTSWLEATLFCLLEHLAFRSILPAAQHARLAAFGARYGARPAAEQTPYRFDASA